MVHVRKQLIAAGTVLVVVAAMMSAPQATPQQDAAPAAQVDALFLRLIRPDTPGCAVGVYRKGEIVLARGYGVASIESGRPITPRSVFNLGSGAKPLTAVAALMLEQRGRLSMDDEVRRWVPELPQYSRPIRVRDLLHHTSDLGRFRGA
jgi:CubicO group peptidase (beta-lactamase class C family)